MRRTLHALVLCCLLTTGCTAGGPGGSGASPTATASPSETPTATPPPATPTPTTEPTPRPEPTPAVELASTGTECDGSPSVSFWGLDEGFWTRDTVRVAYYLPPNTSVLLVTYVDGTVRDVTARNNTNDDGFNADGDKLALATRLSGTHVVRTVVYRDTDGDGQFEKGVDAPCLVDGEVVQAGPTRVNFSRFG